MQATISRMNYSVIYPRFAQSKLQDALADMPAVLIHGARQCGKTTLARMAGGDYAYFSFDDKNVLAAAKRVPVGFVDRLPQRAVLDEVQRISELFATLKYSLDRDRKPGRFLLMGSANLMLLPQLSDSLAGRIEVLQLFPLAQCELAGRQSTFLQQMFGAAPLATFSSNRLGDELIERIVNCGFPEPLRRATESRRRVWYRNYIDSLIQRDIRDIVKISSLEAIPKLLQMIANHSGQLVAVAA